MIQTMIQELGRYQIQERVGQGAMADVYRAYDPSIDRILAIKILKSELQFDSDYAAFFLREAKSAGALSHPNIVTIYDAGNNESGPYIVMEYLDGETLDHALSSGRIFSSEEIISIGYQLADALSYAHAHGVIHRDIKPSNINLSKDGKSIKILDFGIARKGNSSNPNPVKNQNSTQSANMTSMVGTPRYMSPEQAKGERIDGRSDLFSVGAVLYELISGKKAFPSGSMDTLINQITEKDVVPLQSVAPNIPGGLQFIIAKLLAKKPERRFQSGRHLSQALQRELTELEMIKQEQPRRRYFPLALRMSLLMSAIVGLVLLGSIWLVLNRQRAAMEDVAITSGAATVAFIAGNAGLTAAENAALPKTAVPDWTPIEAFVRVAAEDQNIAELAVIDVNGIVRGSENPKIIGRKYNSPVGERLIRKQDDLTVLEMRDARGSQMFRFLKPIRYGNGVYGQVDAVLRQNKLEAANKLTRALLTALAIITLTAVALTAAIVTGFLIRPLMRLKTAFDDVIRGNLDFRLSHTSQNEMGDVFDSFNRFANVMQDRLESARNVALETSQLRFVPPGEEENIVRPVSNPTQPSP
jgi:eukaryotic-like serine/threonine-protein kinase